MAKSNAANEIIAWARANPDEALEEAARQRYDRDPLLVRILKARGDYGKAPRVLSDRQVNDLVADGGLEWFHGFGSERGRRYAEEFTSGRFAPGRGSFGSGFYTGIGLGGLSTAKEYTGVGRTGEQVAGSVILRGALLPSARVATDKQINAMFDRERAAFVRQHPAMSKGDKAVYEVMFGDIGRFAALHGFDALGKSGNGLILNPAATAVQKRLIPQPKGHGYLNKNTNLAVAIGVRAGEAKTQKDWQRIRREEEARFEQMERERVERFKRDRSALAEQTKPARGTKRAANDTGNPPWPRDHSHEHAMAARGQHFTITSAKSSKPAKPAKKRGK